MMVGDNGALLAVEGLRKHFPLRAGWWRRTRAAVKAVDGVSFAIHPGESLALVGESGCGKTTTARSILRLEPPTEGTVLWEGTSIWSLKGQELRRYRASVQAVFQDPWSSMNPRMRVSTIVAEPLVLNRKVSGREVKAAVASLLEQVDLKGHHADRYPHEFSGGQRQRICIARALALGPRLIVLDEPVSSLDVSIRAQIMNLLKDLQAQHGVAYLLIAHHLATVRYLAHRVAVMYLGRIVEEASCGELFGSPLHPYTRTLIAAASPARLDDAGEPTVAKGEVPSPLNPPSGCHFHPRCPVAVPLCQQESPRLLEIGPGRQLACHRGGLPSR